MARVLVGVKRVIDYAVKVNIFDHYSVILPSLNNVEASG